MKSPFADIDQAFLPFFDSAFAVTTKDGRKTTIRASLFADMTGDPFSEGAMETGRKDIVLVCREEDWPWIKANVSRGDRLVSDGSAAEYRVSQVEDDFTVGKIIRARSI